MNTIYLKDLSGCKVVNTYPNPQIVDAIKDDDLVRVHIIDKDDIVTMKRLTPNEIAWYCPQIKDKSVTMLHCNWFPKELIAGVIDHRFDKNAPLSQLTGWIQSVNTGSNAECFFTNKVHEALNILEQNGFTVKY